MFTLKSLGAIALMFASTSSLACSCETRDPQDLFKRADSVFLAKITDTRLLERRGLSPSQGTLSFGGGPESADTVEAKFVVIETFKKSEREVTSVHDLPFGIGNCSIPLLSGQTYVFFTTASGAQWNYVGSCTGSALVNSQAKDYQAHLEKLRSYGQTKQ